MAVDLTFLGAVGTVTGSKYLLNTGDRRILIDCGLFQGFKQLRRRNWAPLPVDLKSIDAVLLTHAHVDHSGYLPALVRDGYSGPIYATPPTCELCDVLLHDSGHLMEREAEQANRYGYSKHKPAVPLYTEEDAELALEQFRAQEFEEDLRLGDDLRARFLPAGHILGASMIEVFTPNAKILFSGDLGRPGSATMVDPTPVKQADFLVVESTYGNRLHDKADAEERIAEIVNKVAQRGGTVLIPSFAVGRSQMLLYHISRLKKEGRIPDLPVYLDSPMAIDASELFWKYRKDHRLTEEESRETCQVATYVRSPEESKRLDENIVPKIIVSASGMATGGRILHHLKRYLPDRRNFVLFAGFQAGGTRGRALVTGAQKVKIHGSYHAVRADVDNLDMLSAHADADEILGWLKNFETPPRMTFITHGEPEASDALRLRIEEELGWECTVPEFRDAYDLV